MTINEGDDIQKAMRLAEAIVAALCKDVSLINQAPEILANVESAIVEQALGVGVSLRDAAYLAACFETCSKLVVDRMLARRKLDRDAFMVAKMGWDVQLAAHLKHQDPGELETK